MRWWMWTLGLVVAGAVAVSLWRGTPEVAGERLLRTIESKRGTLRGALVVMDYAPDPAGVAAAQAVKLSRGKGGLLGIDPAKGVDDPRHWISGPGVEFVGRDVARDDQPLRAAVAKKVANPGELGAAFGHMGYPRDGVRRVLTQASRELEQMADEELLLAWLRADRAVMAQSENIVRGAREGLLLLAREGESPVIVFDVRKNAASRVYLFPGMQQEASVWAGMEAYRDGKMQWTGVLRMTGGPAPEKVRHMAVRLAEEMQKPD